MNVLCIIPARGGSKRLPGKNIMPLAGKPLLAYSVEHAVNSGMVDRTVVSTDDPDIGATAEDFGAEVIVRPRELSIDTATSESALVHALDHVEQQGYETDLIVFLQCTSPVRRSDDIDKAIQTLLDSEADSLFSAALSWARIWRRSEEKFHPLNYDYKNRKREQESEDEFLENGSIYVFRPWVLREQNNRLGGKIAVYEMDFWASFQIDSQEDLDLCEWIIRQKLASPEGMP
jgi:N-acylneuraminate cytidylyltransferase